MIIFYSYVIITSTIKRPPASLKMSS